MTKPKVLLTDVEVDEISLVDKGDNPKARFLLAKRKGGGEGLYQAALNALEGAIGAVSEPLRKRLYADVRADQAKEDAAYVMRKRIDALAQALYSAIYFSEGDSVAEVKKSVAQFAEEVSDDAKEILTGRIVKAFGERDAPPTQEEFTEEFASQFDELVKDLEQPGAGGPDKKEGGMDKIDLSKLSDADRATVEKALKAAEKVEGLEAKVAELEKGKEDPKKEPTKEDLLKGVPENIVKLIEARDANHNAELEKRDKVIAKLTADAEREAFEKTLDLPNISAKRPELAKILFDLPAEKRDEVVKILKAADGQVAQSAEIMKTLGADGGNDNERSVTAKSKMEAAVAEIMKSSKEELTYAQAYTKALEAHPELFKDLN